MLLKKEILDKTSPRLVERINEIYHDLENKVYDSRHVNMDDLECDFWERVAKNQLAGKEPLVCLDYGTGTGLVPVILGPYLKQDDTVICADISSEMLKVCERKISEHSFKPGFSFVKIDGIKVPLEDKSVDIITVNSVLHHLYDLKAFSKECRRILKPGGLLIVSHEPASGNDVPFLCSFVRSLAKILLKPKSVFVKLAQTCPFAEKSMRKVLNKTCQGYSKRNKMLSDIAKQIKREGLIDVELRGVEIQQVVDFQTQKGFNKNKIKDVFPHFKIIEWTTYNYLGFYRNNFLFKIFDKFIRNHWPNSGKNFRFIMSLQETAS